jgi:hypothetical protein
MHRPLTIPVVAILLAFAPLSAQRGGGHASAGGHAGMAVHGGFAGHSGGGHGFGGGGHGFGGGGRVTGSHAIGGHAIGSSHSHAGFTPHSFGGSSFHHSFPSRRHHHSAVGLQIRTRDRDNCRGFECRERFEFPWWYAGAYDPYWWDSGSTYDADQEREIALANEMNAQSLEDQRMRQQSDQDTYARSDPPPTHAEQRSEVVPPTVLVFRDQRKKEVQNYAIVGQTLWNFAPQHTEKIPLSDLDLPATAKANDERGVDFRIPGSDEAQ